MSKNPEMTIKIQRRNGKSFATIDCDEELHISDSIELSKLLWTSLFKVISIERELTDEQVKEIISIFSNGKIDISSESFKSVSNDIKDKFSI